MAAHPLDSAGHNGQANARAVVCFHVPDSLENPEDFLVMRRVDPNAIVLDVNSHARVLMFGPDLDAGWQVRGREFERIVQQVR